MKLEDEILINKYGQSLIVIKQLEERFSSFSFNERKLFLNDFLNIIIQSKPKIEDIEKAIKESKLKSTYTPCVLLMKGIEKHNLKKLIGLPENELEKVFLLLISLFKIAYLRRFEVEKNKLDKWWYWDLSDEKKVETIIKNYLF